MTLIYPSYLSHRFLFTDYNRLSSVGGETSMAEMIATLSDACEREFGFLAARLFRVFKTDEIQGKLQMMSRCASGGINFHSYTYFCHKFMQNAEKKNYIPVE